MSSIAEYNELSFNKDTVDSYYDSGLSYGISIRYRVQNLGIDTVTIFSCRNGDGSLFLNQAAKNTLFPNSKARALKMDYQVRCLTPLFSSKTYSWYFTANDIAQNVVTWNWAGNFEGYARTFSGSYDLQNNPTRDNCNIEIRVSNQGSLNDSVNLKLYFCKYSLNAIAGSGISSASVSNANPWDGEDVTYTATVENGYSFAGWYADFEHTQLISSSPTYVDTAYSDKILYAYAVNTSTKAYSIKYGEMEIANGEVTPPLAITYNDLQIASVVSGQTRMLNCSGKMMAGNVIVDSKMLNCGGKLMNGDIAVSLA